jgi:hypothetical protein
VFVSPIKVVDIQLQYTIRDITFAVTGGITVPASGDTPGRVWVSGNFLLYVDYYGNIRIIDGVLVGASSDTPVGSVYVVASQLRWVSNTSPGYEFAAINSTVI